MSMSRAKEERRLYESGQLPTSDRRGVMFLAKIPTCFRESHLRKYFGQIGVVTRVRLQRSKKTGNPCGYGWVEFASPDVARVAAEHMNGYLLEGRALYAEVLEVGTRSANMMDTKFEFLGGYLKKWAEDMKKEKDFELDEIDEDRKDEFREQLNKQLKSLKKRGIKWVKL